MALDQQLLEILACPDTHHAPLDHDAGAQTLTCTECGRIFEIRDDIPILLLDEAREPGPAATQPPGGTEPDSAVAAPSAGPDSTVAGPSVGPDSAVASPSAGPVDGEPAERPVAAVPGTADEEGK